MALFDYTAVDQHGRQQRGRKEADSEREVRHWLRQRHWAPIQVSGQITHRPHWWRGRHSDKSRLAMGPRGVLLFTQQLGVMLQAGLPLENALQIMAVSAGNAAQRETIEGLRRRLCEGESLAAAVSAYPRSFSPLYSALIDAGERGAGLGKVLKGLHDHLQSDSALRQKTIAATLYPLLLAVISIAIVVGLLTFIVPTVVEIFQQGGQLLPVPTRMLLAASDFFVQWSGGLVALLLLAVVGGKLICQLPRTAPLCDRLRIALPLFGYFAKSSCAERYLRTLGILIQSGVPLHQALSISRQVVTNRALQVRLNALEKKVAEGQALSVQLPLVGIFSPFVVALVASAEQSGTLGAQLLEAASHQQQQITARLNWMLTLLEPAMLLVMGAIVLFVVAAVVLPIFNMNQLIQ